MINFLKQKNRLHEIVFMGTLVLFCFGLSLFRFIYTDTKLFLFLNWNLFLACIPWILTICISMFSKIERKKFVMIFMLISWLLFFPNAPYILTDLFHLRVVPSVSVWFDLILILSFAWTGLLAGMLSLFEVEKFIHPLFPKIPRSLIPTVLLFLASFGVYIGRFLRWNSWDIISQPFSIIYDIGDRVINPLAHPRTWGMTILLGIFLNIIYWSFKLIKKSR